MTLFQIMYYYFYTDWFSVWSANCEIENFDIVSKSLVKVKACCISKIYCVMRRTILVIYKK